MLTRPPESQALARRLLYWFDRNRRAMPWRGSTDPYAIWISELMLQQTQVATVVPYFERFMQRFPTVQALAGATIEHVLQLWAGLGYYARARNMHKAARLIRDRHAGRIPSDVVSLLALPGIGPYTAGAIASIAYGQREALVDGNVARVLARLLAMTEPINRPAGQRRLWAAARAMLPRHRCSEFNQALMELGATLCAPRRPDCERCPVAEHCAARRTGQTLQIPVKARTTPPRPLRLVAVALCRDGRWLFERRAPGGLWGGLWQLPTAEASTDAASTGESSRNAGPAGAHSANADSARAGDVAAVKKITCARDIATGKAVARAGDVVGVKAIACADDVAAAKKIARRATGATVRIRPRPLTTVTWPLSHRTATFVVYAAELPRDYQPIARRGQRWLRLAQALRLPLSAAMRQITASLRLNPLPPPRIRAELRQRRQTSCRV